MRTIYDEFIGFKIPGDVRSDFARACDEQGEKMSDILRDLVSEYTYSKKKNTKGAGNAN